MEQSRFGRYSKSKVKRHPASKVVPGSFENRDRYYECWNCGFVFDRNQVSTGVNNGRYQTEGVYTISSPRLSGDPLSVQMSLYLPFDMGTMMELGPDGSTPKPIVATLQYHAGSGCPLCGISDLF